MKLLPALLLGLAPAVAAVAFSGSPQTTTPQTGQPGQDGRPQTGEDLGPDPRVSGGDADERISGGDDVPPEAAPPGSSGVDIFGRRRADRPSRVTDRLMGCWQMTELFLVGSSSAGRKAQGALLVSDGFISFELHAAWSMNASTLSQVAAQDVPESDVHVSFTAEYTLDGSGLLATSTILGSYIDEETGTLQWERPGYRREYQVTQRLGELILTWGNKGEPVNRMIFRRRIPTEDGDRDIFGAKRGAKGLGEGLDIFGQPKKVGSGLRDVFGREEGDGSEEQEEDEEETKGGDEGAGDGE